MLSKTFGWNSFVSDTIEQARKPSSYVSWNWYSNETIFMFLIWNKIFLVIFVQHFFDNLLPPLPSSAWDRGWSKKWRSSRQLVAAASPGVTHTPILLSRSFDQGHWVVTVIYNLKFEIQLLGLAVGVIIFASPGVTHTPILLSRSSDHGHWVVIIVGQSNLQFKGWNLLFGTLNFQLIISVPPGIT